MGRKKGRRRAPFKLKLKKDTLYSIASVILMAISAIIIFSFTGQGTLLNSMNQSLASNFGFATLFMPFIFVSAGLMMTQLNWKVARPNVFFGSLLIFTSILGLGRSGSIGKEIFLNLAVLVHSIGATILFFAVGLIGFTILTETPLSEIMLFISKIFSGFKSPRFSSKTKKSTISFESNKKSGFTIKGTPEADPSEKKDSKADSKKSSQDKKEDFSTQIIANQPGAEPTVWKFPSLDLLEDKIGGEADRGDIKKNAGIIEDTLDHFGIKTRVTEVNLGPAVTQYALEIKPGTKLSKISALQNDLALALAAPRGQIRIEAPIPSRSLVGIEIPNRTPEFVPLKRMLTSDLKKDKSKISVALGLNVSNEPIVADVKKMPHILIAGATGSGKSVCINAFIATILFRASPNEVKFILVDPKRVELTPYNGIPHLLTPVIVEPEKVVSALKWSLAEMERRYKLFAEVGVRNIESYNEFSGFHALPYIMIIIDELADIMLFAPSEVEGTITRLAQMARATGIHLILATQRPSVDVITGLIKANIPCRIAFNVTSMVDSRVIIDTPGAEKLLGRGDMLYIPPEQSKPTRIQGAFVSDKEIKNLIGFLKTSGMEPQYTEEVTTKYNASKVAGATGMGDDTDELFEDAIRLVIEYDRASASLLQRRLSVGYARAARIIDQLQAVGAVSVQDGSKPREVLIKNADEFIQSLKEINS
jgi:S-DNA-T family DNA segregation ATPase FtsK/SpoIIIE